MCAAPALLLLLLLRRQADMGVRTPGAMAEGVEHFCEGGRVPGAVAEGLPHALTLACWQ